ncbi:unnamed protein product [Orchesella dallaii]|uniref:Uncharacterized protein n=1 Tax=Orchesella dallaii TaxID=48710 RepID=A0ABP1PHH8_9HEXA
MKYIFIIIILAYARTSAFASTTEKDSTSKISSLKFPTIPEKLGLLLLSTVQPNKFRNLSRQSLQFDLVQDFPFIDHFFVDFRSILTQAIKVEEGIPLPEINWRYNYEYCDPQRTCYNYTLTTITANSKMTGQNETSSVNEVSGTQFKNSFRAPHFTWQSPEFLHNLTDNENGDQYLYTNLFIELYNLTMNTTFNYGYVQDVGIEISNFSIDFGINSLRTNIRNTTIIHADGSVEIEGPIRLDFATILERDFDIYREKYQTFLQNRINCILSGFRDECEVETESTTKQFHRMNILQLFETIGLGSMDRH